MAADLDRRRIDDKDRLREDRDLDIEHRQLVGLHGREPRILERGGARAMHDENPERIARFRLSDAATEIAASMQRNERAGLLGVDARVGRGWRRIAEGGRNDGRAGKPHELQSLVAWDCHWVCGAELPPPRASLNAAAA